VVRGAWDSEHIAMQGDHAYTPNSSIHGLWSGGPQGLQSCIMCSRLEPVMQQVALAPCCACVHPMALTSAAHSLWVFAAALLGSPGLLVSLHDAAGGATATAPAPVAAVAAPHRSALAVRGPLPAGTKLPKRLPRLTPLMAPPVLLAAGTCCSAVPPSAPPFAFSWTMRVHADAGTA
jgi:hypothetical protein